MQTINLQPIPSQNLQTQIGGQNTIINVYSKQAHGIFVDVVADGVTVATGIIARDAVPLVAATYLGFIGNLMFIDTQGSDDPFYSGLGTRFQLVYLTADEYALID